LHHLRTLAGCAGLTAGFSALVRERIAATKHWQLRRTRRGANVRTATIRSHGEAKSEPGTRAIIAVGDTIRAQTMIMGYADCFVLLGVVLLAAAVLVALLGVSNGPVDQFLLVANSIFAMASTVVFSESRQSLAGCHSRRAGSQQNGKTVYGC
jgi:hypothetical protein